MRWVILFGSLFIVAVVVIGLLLWSLWKRSRVLMSELTATAESMDEMLSASPTGRTMNGGSPELRGSDV